ncbi:MAG: VWA domain-containing protein [Saprospiraceae bacterium]|nr:VWA domain-containing protein [Saprospiraceae bacterium]
MESITQDISKDNSTDLYGAVLKGVDKINTVAIEFTNDDLSHAAAMVVFTDGTDQAARFTKDQAVNAVKGANKEITFYSIGLGSEIDTESLKSIGKKRI